MPLPFFPISPSPADLTRQIGWGTNKVRFDSGAQQGMTPWRKPLYQYNLGFRNINPDKRDAIVQMVNSIKGPTFPFFFPDPYDYVTSAMVVRSGITNGASVQVFDISSFMIRPASVQVSTLFSALSGFVTNGTEFNYNLESGWITVTTKSNTDVWGVRSLTTLFKKCFLREDYADQSRLWQIWQSGLSFEEAP